MAFVSIAAGTAIAGTLYSAGKGIAQSAKANSINKANQRPTYQIPTEYQQNLDIANQLAQQGIPQQAYNNQVNGINQNQAAGLDVLSHSANPGAGVSSLARQGNQAIGNLNAADANARVDGLKLAMQTRGQIAQQKLAAQQYNQFDKYTENYNKAAALQGASGQNINNAVNGLSGVATGLASYTSGNGYTNPATQGNYNRPGATLAPGVQYAPNTQADPTQGLGDYWQYMNGGYNG